MRTLRDFDQSWVTVPETVWLYVKLCVLFTQHGEPQSLSKLKNLPIVPWRTTLALSAHVFRLWHQSKTPVSLARKYPTRCNIFFAKVATLPEVLQAKLLPPKRHPNAWDINSLKAVSNSSMLLKVTLTSLLPTTKLIN